MTMAVRAARAKVEHHYAPNEPKPRDIDSPVSEDEVIKVHYLKHHPMYEFKSYEKF